MNLNKKLTLIVSALAMTAAVLLHVAVTVVQSIKTKQMSVATLSDRRDAARAKFTLYMAPVDQDLLLWAEQPLMRMALGFLAAAYHFYIGFGARRPVFDLR